MHSCLQRTLLLSWRTAGSWPCRLPLHKQLANRAGLGADNGIFPSVLCGLSAYCCVP